jgi:pantetheine-phosphate adenylyltransferase|tara:strand:+ start:919 stop:1380 length:462 start_codon:yes stop_codon:yes gene_type:complete
MRKAVFPGSFDPITRGHLNILERSLPLFDEIVVAVGVNSAKTSMYSMEQRLRCLELVTERFPNVSVQTFEGLTSAFCEKLGANWLIRGVRNGGDFEYERTIAQMTKSLNPALETVILFTDPEFAHIHSNVVREILRNGGDASAFIPSELRDEI